MVSVGGSTGTRRFYNTNYKLRVEHDLTPNNLVYAMVSSGFLPGDVQVTSAPAVVPYASETLTAYEIGGKNRFLDDTLQLNASVYYYRYGGFQTNYNPNSLDPSSAQQVTLPARMLGGEVELLYQFTANDRFGLNYSYTDGYYVDKPEYIQSSIPQSHLAIAPHRASANYEHTFHLSGGSMLVARADANYVSAHRMTNLTQALLDQGAEAYVQQDNELIANLGLTWSAAEGKYAVSGWVRNVTDEVYASRVFVQSIANIYGDLSEPRTYGVTLSARF